MPDTKDVRTHLSTLGFTRAEQEILLCLCDFPGYVRAATIASVLEIPRQTAYSMLKKLRRNEAILYKKEHSTGLYWVTHEKITQYILNRCNKMQQAAKALVPALFRH